MQPPSAATAPEPGQQLPPRRETRADVILRRIRDLFEDSWDVPGDADRVYYGVRIHDAWAVSPDLIVVIFEQRDFPFVRGIVRRLEDHLDDEDVVLNIALGDMQEPPKTPPGGPFLDSRGVSWSEGLPPAWRIVE